MKKINIYITEKLVINKNSSPENMKDYEEATARILALCEISPGNLNNFPVWLKDNKDNIYFETVNNWVSDNNINEKDLKYYADKNMLYNYVRMVNTIHWFEDDPKYVKDICKEYIENGKGKEVLGKSWNDPKIYYDDKVLIYHIYDNKYGNIDRVFVKEK